MKVTWSESTDPAAEREMEGQIVQVLPHPDSTQRSLLILCGDYCVEITRDELKLVVEYLIDTAR